MDLKITKANKFEVLSNKNKSNQTCCVEQSIDKEEYFILLCMCSLTSFVLHSDAFMNSTKGKQEEEMKV